MTIREIGPHKCMFQFFHVGDLKRVIEGGGPWSFDNYLLVLSRIQSGAK